MKRIVLFALLMCFTVVSKAQFAPIGSTWHYSLSKASNPLYSYEKYVSIKDTSVAGENCRVIKSSLSKELMYSKNNKVFYYFMGGYRLIYDYNSAVNDTITFSFKAYKSGKSISIDTVFSVKAVVQKIDTINIGGKLLKRFNTSVIKRKDLSYIVWPSNYQYIENIGYEYQFMLVLIPPSTDDMHNLRCYSDNSITYKTDWWKSINKDCEYAEASGIPEKVDSRYIIYPNPSQKSILIQASLQDKTNVLAKIFNGLGQEEIGFTIESENEEVDISTLRKGIYYLYIYKNNKIVTIHKILKN